MTAAFLPFPTSVLAQALHHGGTAERTAVVFYGAAALVIELVLRAAERYAAAQAGTSGERAHRRRRRPEPSASTGWRRWASTLLYAVAILFAVFLFPKVAVIGYLGRRDPERVRCRQRRPAQPGLWLAGSEAMEESLIAASRSVWRRRTPT